MRRAAPVTQPVVLTIAGSDSGGGAGIQADIKTIEAHGCFATSAVTAVTAQHTRGVERVDVLEPAAVTAQIDAVIQDLRPAAMKTGMLATAGVIDAVTEAVAPIDVPLVVDPVMVAASGDRLLDRDAEDAYDRLLAHATVVTPNADEAEVLTGVEVTDAEAAAAAGQRLLDRGPESCLVKGGHWGGERIADVLVTRDGVDEFVHPRIDTDATHGSGCTLASAIASRLARGQRLAGAVGGAIAFIDRAVRYHHAVGEGPGAVNHLADLDNRAAVEATVDAVRSVVRTAIDADVGAVLPEVGTNVVGALPFAESVDETAAVDGRIVATADGPAAVGGVRMGASSHVARLLLADREHRPALRFAANCRSDDDTVAALEALDWPVVEVDRRDEPEAVAAEEGRTMPWVARVAFAEATPRPVAVFDRGDLGKEAMTRLFAEDADELADRLVTLADAVQSS
ncbi:MAG: bifunctional hydroxymethylpyrimidine kinase/phosphomethylpyrimidine kinase [Halobacteriales archaeon]